MYQLLPFHPSVLLVQRVLLVQKVQWDQQGLQDLIHLVFQEHPETQVLLSVQRVLESLFPL